MTGAIAGGVPSRSAAPIEPATIASSLDSSQSTTYMVVFATSAHGPSGRIASCVLDPLGQANPRTHAGRESIIWWGARSRALTLSLA